MKIPAYISPSQCNLFYSDRSEYVRMYLADNKPPRMRQTSAMAVGGTVDSHVKRALGLKYYGADDPRMGGEFDLDTMIASNVEEHLDRRRMRGFGRELFDKYVSLSGYGRLCAELDRMDPGSLLMEQTVFYNHPSGMTLMGKPDFYWTVDGVVHVYDLKVNGFFSASGASPIRGHVWSSTSGGPHKEAILGRTACGTTVDLSGYFDSTYRRQVTTYKLALVGLGDHFVAGIEQIACKPASSRTKDEAILSRDGLGIGITCASARSLVSEGAQLDILNEYLRMYEIIQSGWIFDNVTRAESDDMIGALERECAGMAGDDADADFNFISGRR